MRSKSFLSWTAIVALLLCYHKFTLWYHTVRPYKIYSPPEKKKLYGYKVTKISAVWVTAITYLVWKVEELGLYFTTIQFFFLPTEKISMVRKKTKLSSLEDKQLPTFTTKEGSVTCVLTPYNFFIAPKKKFYGWTSTKSFEAWKKQLTISRKLITEFF